MVKDDKTTQTEIFVIRGARQALLGRPTIEALELISSVQSVEKGTMEAKCKFKFPKLFKGLGKLEEILQYLSNPMRSYTRNAPRDEFHSR